MSKIAYSVSMFNSNAQFNVQISIGHTNETFHIANKRCRV